MIEDILKIENTLEWINEKETTIENKLIHMLWDLGVSMSVKTDRKSLPYKETFETTLNRSSYFSPYFNFTKTYREITQYILNKEYRKIRFYCELIPIDTPKEYTLFTSLPDYKCLIRYYVHN